MKLSSVEEEENMLTDLEDDDDILDEDVVVVKDMVNSDTDSNIEDLDEAEMTINDDGLIIRRGEDEVHSAGPKLIRRWKRQYQRFQELLCILRDDEEEEEFNYLFEKFTGDSLAARVINRMNTSTATAADATSSTGDLSDFDDSNPRRSLISQKTFDLTQRSVSFTDLRYGWTKKEREMWMNLEESDGPRYGMKEWTEEERIS